MQSYLFILSLRCWVFWVLFRKSFPITICCSVFPTASWSCFKVSGLILRSLIHFELILVQGERQGSSFSLLHVDIQFSQSLSFLHRVFWAPLLKIRSAWFYVWIFYSDPFVFLSCANTMLFLLLWLCSIVWSLVLWCLQHQNFCSELLWLFKVFCVSICISWLIFLLLCSKSLELSWTCSLLLVVWPFSQCWFYQSMSVR
jgi:hypothetical protein